MWDSGAGMGWWMLWGGGMMVLFWGAIIGLIVWAVRSATGRPAGQPTDRGSAGQSPLDTAKGRYARGEIGRDEFERIRQDVQSP